MDVNINSNSEVWNHYKERTLSDLQEEASSFGYAIYDVDNERAHALQDMKDAISGAAMKTARQMADCEEEALFLMCSIATDIAITALAMIDRYDFECALEDM